MKKGGILLICLGVLAVGLTVALNTEAGYIPGFVFIDENHNGQFDEGEWNHTTIQAAVLAASPGDTIYVWDGEYHEDNITINKTLTIIGNTTVNALEGIGVPTTSYVYYEHKGFIIEADHVNISGFYMTNIGMPEPCGGFNLNHSEYCNISGNIIMSDYDGIYLNDSHYNTIYNNYIADHFVGIWMVGSSHNLIEANNISYNAEGIIYEPDEFMYNPDSYNIIRHNNISYNNEWGIIMGGTDNETIEYNTMYWNGLMYGGGGIHLADITDSIIAHNTMMYNYHLGIWLQNCETVTVEDNMINGTYLGNGKFELVGIILQVDGGMYSTGVFVGNTLEPILYHGTCFNTLANNTISHYDYGVFLNNTDNETLIGNTITHNQYVGVYALNCTAIDIINDNNISYNGIYPSGSCGGIIFRNTSHSTIDGNYFTVDIGGAIITYQSAYNTITHNQVINNCGWIQGIGIMDESNHTYIGHNIFDSNTGPGIRMFYANHTTIEANEITNNPTGIWMEQSHYTNIIGNYIAYNYNENTGIWIGVHSNHTTITHNIIKENGIGIYVYGGYDTNYQNVDTEIHWNLIYNNSQYGLQYYMQYGDTPYINATYNWWGSANGPDSYGWNQYDPITNNTANGYGDYIGGGVLYDNIHFDPWLGLMLYQGWNMIAPAFIDEEMETAEDLGQLINVCANGSVCTVVTMWDNLRQQYVSHIVGYGFDFNLTDGYGYFVYVTQDVNMFYDGGFRWPTINITLYTGYNMIGWPYVWYTTASWLADNITNCTKVAKWDELPQLWLPEYIEMLMLPYDFDVLMGEGVFVFVSDGPVTWRFWPPV